MTKSFSALLAAMALTACAGAPAKPDAPLVPYVCDGVVNNLNADYYTSGKPRVILNVESDKNTLYLVPSANGTRYTNAKSNPPKPGSLVWWTKGTEAIFYQVATRPDGFLYEQQLATCTSNPQPLPVSRLPLANPVGTPDTTNLPGTIPGTAPRLTTQPVTI